VSTELGFSLGFDLGHYLVETTVYLEEVVELSGKSLGGHAAHSVREFIL
jgi:hypothetical protein